MDRLNSGSSRYGIETALSQSDIDHWDSQQIDELNSRVRKLEELLATKTTPERRVSSWTDLQPVRCEYFDFQHHHLLSFPLVNTRTETSTDVELEKTVTWLETDAFEHEPSPPNVS